MNNDACSSRGPVSDGDDGWVRATVTIVSADRDTAWVKPAAGSSACGGCAHSGGCGTRTLMGLFGNKSVPLQVKNNLQAVAGDQVEVGMESTTILKLSALSYLLPLGCLIFFGAIATAAGWSDLMCFLFSICGLIVGFAYNGYRYSGSRRNLDAAPICLRHVARGNERFVDVESLR